MLQANKKIPIRQSDEEIDNILRHELLKINGWDNKKRLEYISKRKVLRKFQNQNIYSNGVFLLDNFFVAKKLHNNMNGYVFWKNEINCYVVGYTEFPEKEIKKIIEKSDNKDLNKKILKNSKKILKFCSESNFLDIT